MPDGIVLDTSVLIDFKRNVLNSGPTVIGLLNKSAAFVHPVCAAELLAGARDNSDLDDTVEFVDTFRRLSVKPSDFDVCISLLSQYGLSHGTEWPDCLIAATCMRLKMPLMTLNYKHFSVIKGLRIIRPY